MELLANRGDLIPKFFSYLKRGYNIALFKSDILAGLTVAIVALPLSMAIAIASGVSPNVGLKTAFVAGFWISVIGGSRFQVGGPTAAFALVVAGIIAKHGFDGLVLATFFAGIFLMIAGLLRLGALLKYIPNSVVMGFTTGIAITIMITQIPAFFGISPIKNPPEITGKLISYAQSWHSLNIATIAVSLICLFSIIAIRKVAPKLPYFLIIVVVSSILVYFLNINVQTVGAKFGNVATTIPNIAIPKMNLELAKDVLPSSLTIAFLAAIESLLSAMVADGMTGARHRPNAELMGQGFANIMSAITGGLPATGAIARTATNIRAGAKTPMAGAMHACLLLIILLIAGKLTAYIPMAALSAILVIVAWNMAEAEKFIRFLKYSQNSDRAILLITLFLTVFADLTVAVEAGVVLSSLFLMHKLAQNFEVEAISKDKMANIRSRLPENCEMFQINGPLFFGAVSSFIDAIENISKPINVLIIDMFGVPFIDSSGKSALEDIIIRMSKRNTDIIFANCKSEIASEMNILFDRIKRDNKILFADNFDEAINICKGLNSNKGNI